MGRYRVAGIHTGGGMVWIKPFLPGAVILCFEAYKPSTTYHTVTHCPLLESPCLCCILSLGYGTLEVVVGSVFTWLSNYILDLVAQQVY